MGSKEELYIWFKDLDGAKRIEVVCNLFNMCFPLELRFFGTYIADLCRVEYHKLGDIEKCANSVYYFANMKNMDDFCTRSRLISSVALIKSQNRQCSDAVYKFINKSLQPGSKIWTKLLEDKKAPSEILLLLTLVVHHPAFTFEQKAYISQQLRFFEQVVNDRSIDQESVPQSRQMETKIDNLETKLTLPVVEVKSSSPVMPKTPVVSSPVSPILFEESNINSKIENKPQNRKIKNLELKGTSRKKTYRIEVTWSFGKTEALKTYKEISDFHRNLQLPMPNGSIMPAQRVGETKISKEKEHIEDSSLLQLFPEEAQSSGPDKYIPALPVLNSCGNFIETLSEQTNKVGDYLRKFINHAPVNVKDSDFVIAFFQPSNTGRSPPALVGRSACDSSLIKDKKASSSNLQVLSDKDKSNSDSTSPSSDKEMLPSTSNSQNIVNDSNGRARWTCYPPISKASSASSKSSEVSPPGSRVHSPSGTPTAREPDTIYYTSVDLLKKLGFYKYIRMLRQFSLQQLKLMTVEQLINLGMNKTDAEKLKRKMQHNSLPHFPSNQIIKTSVVPFAEPLDSAERLRAEVTSDQSSSEFDEPSPPVSPSPSDQSSASSSSTENLNQDIVSSNAQSFNHTGKDFCKPKLLKEEELKTFNQQLTIKSDNSSLPQELSRSIVTSIDANIYSSSSTSYTEQSCFSQPSKERTSKHFLGTGGTVMPSLVSEKMPISANNSVTNMRQHSSRQKKFLEGDVATQQVSNSSNSSVCFNTCVTTANTSPLSPQYMSFLPNIYPPHIPIIHSPPNGYASVPPSFLIPLLQSLPPARLPADTVYNGHQTTNGFLSASPSLSPQEGVIENGPSKLFCYNCGSSSHLGYECKGETIEDYCRSGIHSRYMQSAKSVEMQS